MRIPSLRTAWIIEPSSEPIATWMTDALRLRWGSILARHRLALRFHRARDLEETESLLGSARCDLVFVATRWQDPREAALRVFERASRRRGRPKLAFLDTSDPTSSPFFGLLPYVDLLVKKQLLRPLSRYREIGGTGHIVANEVYRRHGVERPDWRFGEPLPAEHEHKVALGWSLGSARHLLRKLGEGHLRRLPRQTARRIDVHLRVGLAGDGDWYTLHRRDFADALEPLRRTREVVSAAGAGARVSPRRFDAEMRAARIAVCPFGWGEITDREFTAASHLCLVVKPDMAHVASAPDVYRPGVTYVPVRWDGTDLASTCAEYLERPEDAGRIAAAFRATYRRWFLGDGFMRRFGAILRRVDCASEGSPAEIEEGESAARQAT